MKTMIDDVMATVTDEQYFRELFNAQKLKTPQEMFVEWIHKNYRIGNGKMLVERMEDMQTQQAFIKDAGLPDGVELI